MTINESTFEARAQAAIAYIFPNYTELELTHQLIFSVRLGHHVEDVKPSLKKPRLDILISYKGQPLTILELKKPEQSITNEDRDQGLSYARLCTPMPPLVILSNGKNTTRFFNTYTGTEMTVQTTDEVELQKLFTNALMLAAEQQDIAIRTLLGKDPELWGKIVSDLTHKGLINHTGSIHSFQEPIADSFHLPRKSTRKVLELLRTANPVIAVTGAPLSGKTNVLHELCHLQDPSFVPLYINVADCRYGIMQYIANHFSRYFSSASSIEDVRIWLIRGVIGLPHVAGKLAIIIDGVRHTDQSITAEIDELIDLCDSGTSSALIVACDSTSFGQMRQIHGRGEKTLFGKRAKQIEVKVLDDEEFIQARQYFHEQLKAHFNVGADYSKELRNPRILRMFASGISGCDLAEDRAIYLPTFMTFYQFETIITEFREDPQFIDDMSKLVKAYLERDRITPLTPQETLLSYGHGHVPYDIAVEQLGEERIQRLGEQGYIEWYQGQDGNSYYLPKVPELFAAAAVHYLVKEAGQKEFRNSLTFILGQSERLPYGDLVAADTIYNLSRTGRIPLFEVIQYLIYNSPKREKVDEIFDALGYFEDIGFFTFPEQLETEVREEMAIIANSFPWLVLSQLVSVPMVAEGSENPWNLQLAILGTVGSYPDILRRFEPSSYDDRKGFYQHAIRSADGQVGNVLCGQHGIVEPITFAMQQGFYKMPTEILRLCKRAVTKKNSFIAHRLHNAASSVLDSVDQDVAKAARKALILLEEIVRHM